MVAEGREVFERRRLSSLARELDLTDEQQTRVRSIMQRSREDRRRAMQSAFERCGDPLKSHKAKVQSDIRAVLTAEQRTRFDELIDEYGDGFLRGPGRQGPHRHGAPPTHAPPH
jgi:Spy/CpxP family protein refolding chaperone